MVAVVDRGGDERRGLRVRPGHGQQVDAHDVGLRADGHQPVDVFRDGHEHFACHVAALFGAGGLVFNVDSSRALFDEQLGQLHHRRQTAVAGVGVRDDRAEVVHVRGGCSLVLGRGEAVLALFSVVEQLRHEQVLHLVRNRVHGVVGQIGRRFVGGGCRGRGLPSRNVDGVEVLVHLGEHGGLEAAVGGRSSLGL